MTLKERRVIVTGGAGFIGSHIVDLLADAGNQVLVVDNLSTGRRRNLARHVDPATGNGVDRMVTLIEADVTDTATMHDLIIDADVVIHMAVACIRTSINHPEFVHEVNATGTLNVCLAAQRNGIGRLVYVSSSDVYGTARSAPMREDHPTAPTTVYGASKLAGEAYAWAVNRTHGLPVVVVRPFNGYGHRAPACGKRAEVIPKFVLRTLAGERPVIFGSGAQTRDFTWVEDLARGIVAAASSERVLGATVNIARGQETSIRQLAEKVLTILGRGGELPVFDAPRPGDIDRQLADATLADRLLGWRPTVSIDEGLRRYIDWVATIDDPHRWLRHDERRNW